MTDRSSPWRHLAVRAIAARSTTQFSFHRERSGDRRDGVSGGKGRGGGSVAAAVTAAMASVTGHCIWFHGKWAPVLFVGRNRKDLAWISAAKLDCSYLRLSSVLPLSHSRSLSLSLFEYSSRSLLLALCRGHRNCVVLFRLYSRALVSVATIVRTRRNCRRSRDELGRRHVVKCNLDATWVSPRWPGKWRLKPATLYPRTSWRFYFC